MQKQTFEFQAEVSKLLDLMIHSLYSHKEIFLRELISNASDALDRRRFAALTQPDVQPDAELGIELEVDSEARSLCVSDNGIGMRREDVVRELGTLARSGTLEFLKRGAAAGRESASPELIGQFGVGFYASFMVAERVEVLTRHAAEEGATRWSSSGSGEFSVEPAERATPGTSVTLQLLPIDEDAGLADYTDAAVLREVVKRYSDFVAYPIRLRVAAADAPGEAASEDAAPLNSMKAIWTRPPEEITEDEHTEFYKHIAHDWEAPLLHISARIEGTLDARALLYVPARAPFDLRQHGAARRGIQLYSRRVFIMDECRELLPEQLRFVKGVVDAEDLSLNISREMLQQDRGIQAIRRHLTKKVYEALDALRSDDEGRYLQFWAEFGAVLKEGLISPTEKDERILDLTMCRSTRSESAWTSLADYVSRMPEEQESIYTMTGPDPQTIAASPHLEAFRERGLEVLLFSDAVDEVWLQQGPPEYRGKRWRSVERGLVAMGAEAEREASAASLRERQGELAGLLSRLRAALQEDVKEVRLSARLTQSPACLVSEEGDLGPKLEEMLRRSGQDVPRVKRILELNPDHPLLAKLQSLFDSDPEDGRLADTAELLYGQALLAEGGQLRDPAAFSTRLATCMERALS